MKKDTDVVWLELKPQQNFKDDMESKLLDVIRYASEFAFFVFCRGRTMRIIIRAPAEETNLFRTIAGISAEKCDIPEFGSVITKYLTLKNSGSMVPLVDLKASSRSNTYQKLWAQDRDSMMACFMYNNTEGVLEKINAKIRRLESEERTRSTPLSSRKKSELAAGIQKRDGQHGYYNCCVMFGIEKKGGLGDEKEEIKHSTKLLDKLIGSFLLNSFAHRISRRKVRLSSEKPRVLQKIFQMLGLDSVVDPYTFVPRKMHSKSMVLTETEIAFFMSFPQENDIRTINFEMGPTPTFMHGRTEEVCDTDLDLQKHDGVP